jgi:hypothetical protein
MVSGRITISVPGVQGNPSWGTGRKAAFHSIVILLVVAMTVAFWKLNFFPVLAWLPEDVLERLYASQLEFDKVEGAFAPHIIHYLALSASHVMVLFGLALQLRRPWTKVAPIWQASGGLALSVLTLPFVIVSVGTEPIPPAVLAVMALVIAAWVLHPSTPLRQLPTPADRLMTGLWAVALIPAAVLTVSQLRLELTGVAADPHWQGLHYNIMAEYGLHVILVGLLGASALHGWRYSAWTASFMIGLLGVGFIVYPDHAGSQGSAWGIAMVVWAALYLMAAETRHRRNRVADQATIDAGREPIRA